MYSMLATGTRLGGRRIAVCAVVLSISACSRSVVDRRFENDALSDAIVQSVSSGKSEIPLKDLRGVNPAAVMCVLEPYRDRVDGEDALATKVNQRLKDAAYVADENHWAVAQLDPEANLQLSIVRQTQVRLSEVKTGAGPQKSCGPPAKFSIRSLSDKLVVVQKED